MDGVILLSMALTVSLLGTMILYFIPFFSKKQVKQGKFDMLQFINLFFTPLLAIPIFYFLRELISSNPYHRIVPIPRYISELSFLILLYFMILGHGIHSVAVVLSKSMKDLTSHKIWHINEFFHQKFSHFLIYTGAMLILFSYSIMEINRPTIEPMVASEILAVIFCGLVTGVIVGIAAIEGGLPKYMKVVYYTISLLIPLIFMKNKLDFKMYPFTTFVETLFIIAFLTITFYGQKKKDFQK